VKGVRRFQAIRNRDKTGKLGAATYSARDVKHPPLVRPRQMSGKLVMQTGKLLGAASQQLAY
jgi:hypothetical protein